MQSRIPLKGYLSLHFGLVAVLPVVIIFLLIWFFMMPALQTRTTIQQQAMARAIAGQISAYLNGGERQLDALAEYLRSREPVLDQGLTDLLDAQCGKGAFFEALFVIDSESLDVEAVGLAASRRANRADYIGLNFSGRHFTKTLGSVKTAVRSDTFLSTISSRMAVALSVPLTGGFITGEVTLDNLSEFISQLPVESQFLTLVIDGQGLIVADSQTLRAGQMLNVNTPVVKDARRGGAHDPSVTFDLDGVKLLGTMVEMDTAGWKVLLAQPDRTAFQLLWDTFALIGFGLAIALGLAMFIAWFLAGHLSVLFASYAEKAASIASGRYQLQWPAARTKEFFQLSQNLQRMAEKISRREKALVDNEERLKDLVANVPGVVLQFKADPKALESSSLTSVVRERSVEIFGLDAEQEDFFNAFVARLPEEDQPRFVLTVKEALEKASPWYYEGRFTKPSGEEIWFEGRSVPRQIDGELVYYGVLTDITRRKTMESSLRLSQFIFDKADIGIFLLGENGEFLNVNEEACRCLGYSREEMCNMSVFDVDNQFTPESWGEHMADLRSHGVKILETFIRHKNGTVFPVQVIDNVMTFEGQEFHVAFVQDITERKSTEKSLRLAQFIIDRANIGIYRIDPAGRIREVNQKAAELLGYTKEELESLTMPDIDPLVARKTWGANWRKLVAKGTRNIEAQHRRKDGSIIPIEVYSNLLEYEGRQYAIAFVQDISERKRIEESLRLTQFIFDKAPIGIWRMGAAGEVLDVNEQGCASLGYSHQELCRMTVFNFAPGFEVRDWEIGTDQLNKTGTKTTEAFHQRKSGEIFPIQVIEKLMRFEGQEYRLAFVQDITQRKQDEDALREKDQLLLDIGRLVKIGAWQYDVETGKATSTDEVIRIHDLEPDQGMNVEKGLSFYHGMHRKKIEHAFNEALEKGIPYDLELEIVSAKGIPKWVRTTGYPAMRDGRVVQVKGSFQDITDRKRMEHALEESEQRLDLALSGANEGIWDWRIPENTLYLDTRYYTMAGYQPNAFPSTYDEVIKRIHKDDVERVKLINEQSLSGNLEAFEVEFRFLRHDGSYMWIRAKGKIVAWHDTGKPARFIGTNADITERKQAEEKLREHEQLLSNILESMNEGVFVLDREFKNTIYNRGMAVITNVPREAVIGKRPWEVFPHIKNTPVEENIRNVMKGEVTVAVMSTHPHHPNMWSRDSFSPLKDTDGKTVGVVGVLTDVTRQKKDEEEMRRLRNFLSNIIDSMPSILVAVNHDGHVTQWNKQAQQATGLGFEKAHHHPLATVFPRLAGEMERVHASIRERRVISSPRVSHRSDNETRFEDITIFPLVANEVEGAVIRVDDVTEKVRLEEMMIQSEKMMSVGGLAAGMAHEINNPLAGILQSISVLSNRLTGDLSANQKAAEAAGTTMMAIRQYAALRKLPTMLENIRASGALAANIVKNMLSFARKSENVIATHDLGALLDQSIDLLKTDYDMKKHYDFKRIKINRLYDQAAGPVPCESSKIQQVFMNILKNGAEAMAEVMDATAPPTFDLRVIDDGDWVRVEIEDNGPGMDERTRRRVFEPFFTTKPVGKGTGLGLSVSYFIVTEDHRGEMGVVTADTGGTCFVIRLPKGGR